MKSKSFLVFISILSGVILLISCGPKKEQVDRIIENGVEVVLNHLEPYRIGDVSTFDLEEIFKIDTEEDEIENLGITNIYGFEVNSVGDIIVLKTYEAEGDFLFKFDRNGKFVKSFGPYGEGPGEFQNPQYIALDSEDNVLIKDSGRPILNKYDKDGTFINGYKMTGGEVKVASGPRTNLLFLVHSTEPKTGKWLFSLKLINPDLEEVQEIEQFGYFLVESSGKFRATEPLFCWSASRDNIYVGKEDRGYDIWVYDSKGNLARKIKKEYRQIPLSESYKEKALKQFPKNARDRVLFPEYHRPFQSLVAGDDGKLLVATFEEGINPGEFMYDIFNEDGVFIGRKSLSIWIWEGHLWAQMKGNKFYSLAEKDNGYKALYVYKMEWE